MGINGKFNENKTRMNSFLLQFEEENSRLNCRFASGQEVKLFYVTRAMRGHRFSGVPTTPRGRGLLLLVLFFG